MVPDLVGREREVAQLTRMLTGERQRLVTLWGPGGIGKTSLARVLLDRTRHFFTGGTELALLAGARDPVDLLAIVATTLELGDGPVSAAHIGRALAARGQLLLVLDNVEQVVGPAASALETWRTLAPEASFLVTSRELLAAAGETPYEILPLGAEAVDLLLTRVRAVRPAFEADAGILQAIAQRLDGIPLALELAAARLAVTSAEQLLARLDDRFAVLRRGHGSHVQRQRTLHDAIDWSWNLLGDEERRALARLSAFRGFDLDAASAVLGHDATEVVSALRHKSLVAEQRGLPGPEPRFFLLESIREFAAAALPGVAKESAAQHARTYASRFSAGPTLGALAAEHDNLMVVAQGFEALPNEALQALVALEPLLLARGAGQQLALLLERALAHAGTSTPTLRALETQASTLLALGQLDAAMAATERALGLATTELERARVLTAQGVVLQSQGRSDQALTALDAALRLAREGSDRVVLGHALAGLALVQHRRGAFVDARATYEEALAILREQGEARVAVRTHARLGFLLHDLGDSAGALAQYEAAARLDGSHGLGLLEAILTGYRGNLRRDAHDHEGAVALYDQAIAWLQRAGDRRFEATFIMDRGISHLLARRVPAARADLEAAARISEEIGDRSLAALALGYLVVLHANAGDPDAASAEEARARAQNVGNAEMNELLDVHHAHISLARGEAASALGPAPFGQHRRLAHALLSAAQLRASPPGNALVVREGRVRVGDGPWLDLQARAAAAAVLTLLVARRLETPGAVVTTSELVAMGWPGEKLVAGAGPNRLRVLVSGLRSGGLKNVLESADGGYRLDPEVPVVTD